MAFSIQKKALCAMALTAALSLLASVGAHAGPFQLSYGGRLTETTGKPVDGLADLAVDFFRAVEGGTPILPAAVAFPQAALDNGVFQITLDLSTADFQTVFPDTETPVFIQVTDVTHAKTYPRQRFSMTPFAAKVPVDGSSIVFDSAGRLTATLPKAGENISGLIKATDAFVEVDAAGDITAIKKSLDFTGTLAGDVTGTQGATFVAKIRGKNFTDTLDVTSDQKVLKWDNASNSFRLLNDLQSGGLGTDDVTSVIIDDDTIVNADINSAAAIAQSKIANLTSDLALKGDVFKNGQTGALIVGTNDATALTLETNNAAALTVLAGGNVGTGTTCPTADPDDLAQVKSERPKAKEQRL